MAMRGGIQLRLLLHPQQRKLHLLQAGVAQVPRFQRDSGGAGVTYSLRTTTTIFPLCSGRVLLFYFFAKTGRVLLTDYTHTAANVIAKNVLVRQDSGTLYTRIYMDELGQNLCMLVEIMRNLLAAPNEKKAK
jgi:hypothetical protein